MVRLEDIFVKKKEDFWYDSGIAVLPGLFEEGE